MAAVTPPPASATDSPLLLACSRLRPTPLAIPPVLAAPPEVPLPSSSLLENWLLTRDLSDGVSAAQLVSEDPEPDVSRVIASMASALPADTAPEPELKPGKAPTPPGDMASRGSTDTGATVRFGDVDAAGGERGTSCIVLGVDVALSLLAAAAWLALASASPRAAGLLLWTLRLRCRPRVRDRDTRCLRREAATVLSWSVMLWRRRPFVRWLWR